MCDFFDDSDFMDGDSFEDSHEGEMDEPSADDAEPDEEFDGAESQDNRFTAKDALILGGAIGFVYEEGLNERKRRKRKRFSDDSG